MQNLILFYILGFFVLSNIVYAWYLTSFGEKVLSIFIKNNNLMYNDIIDLIYEKNSFLSDLLACPICLGTWFSLFISFAIYLIVPLNWYYVLFCTFSWPTLSYKIFISKDI